jgi:predicted GIY-YIG superfamily endonuclease/DNA-binding XRE family transcriptional regulator
MAEYSIYALADPRNNDIRYVGLSSDVYNRFAQHILANGNRAKAEWIASLKQVKLLPLLQVLEDGITTIDEARSKERQWMQRLQGAGVYLTNLSGMCDSQSCELKQIRLDLGISQEGLARRTRSVSTGTIKNAENGRRVTHGTATQILEAINVLLTEVGKPTVMLDDLELTLY